MLLLLKETVKTVEKIDAFMGTNRSLELIRQIAEATSFEKMKDAKGGSMDELGQKIGIVSDELSLSCICT